MDIQVVRAHYRLAGVQVVVDLRQNFGGIIEAGWQKLAQKLPGIANIADPPTGISYMHYVDGTTRIWFVGVLLTTLEGFRSDYGFGLVSWDLGDTHWAVFKERNDQPGSLARVAYGEIGRMGYTYDARFIGEFEKFPLAWAVEGTRPQDGYHDFMLPVKRVAD